MSNALRMPLAEWIYRMRVAGVAREAVGIAFTAAVFEVTSNAVLAELSGHTAGSRTLDKHKGDLVKGGWVLIPPNRGGRGIGSQVLPAVDETPVEFTDVSARNPGKICTALAKQTPASFAPHSAETPAISADVSPRALPCAPARIETPSGLLKPKKLEEKSPFYPPSDGERVTFENGRLELKNGLKQFWLEKFGDAELLDLAVIQAAGYVQVNSSKPLEAQVSSQLAKAMRDKLDKDARYAKAVKANTAKTTTDAAGESRSERWARKLKEIEAEGGMK
jgi:hypothetical protein